MDSTPPELQDIDLGDGYTVLTMPFSTGGGQSFIDGDPTGTRLRIKMFFREADQHLISKVWFGPGAEGPPRHAHGGSMAAVLDHTMGISAWVNGHPVLAANISINFHKSLPLGKITTVETCVKAVEGKKVTTAGRIYIDSYDEPYSSGEGLFIVRSLEKIAGLVDSHQKTTKLDRADQPI
jgi:acyl-coenzyme A thioesterase PaaI-like protein